MRLTGNQPIGIQLSFQLDNRSEGLRAAAGVPATTFLMLIEKIRTRICKASTKHIEMKKKSRMLFEPAISIITSKANIIFLKTHSENFDIRHTCL